MDPTTSGPSHVDPKDDPFALFNTLKRRVMALSDLGMRQHVCREFFASTPHDTASFVLDQLIRATVLGDKEAYECALSCVFWLLRREADAVRLPDPQAYALLQGMYTASIAQDRQTCAKILLDLPPLRKASSRRSGRPAAHTSKRSKRPLSLGERKQLARGSNRLTLERLLADPDPQVLRKLCVNPNILEQDLLTVATRRPNSPDLLRELSTHTRWMSRYALRHAIILNPYAPTSISLKLTPFLHVHDLRSLGHANDVHSMLPEFARHLVSIRDARIPNA